MNQKILPDIEETVHDLPYIFRREKKSNCPLNKSDTKLQPGTFVIQCISLHTPQRTELRKTPPELFSEAMTGKMSVNSALFLLAGVKSKDDNWKFCHKHNFKYQNIYHAYIYISPLLKLLVYFFESLQQILSSQIRIFNNTQHVLISLWSRKL